jgi:Mg-chelatase subunit ChlD
MAQRVIKRMLQGAVQTRRKVGLCHCSSVPPSFRLN